MFLHPNCPHRLHLQLPLRYPAFVACTVLLVRLLAGARFGGPTRPAASSYDQTQILQAAGSTLLLFVAGISLPCCACESTGAGMYSRNVRRRLHVQMTPKIRPRQFIITGNHLLWISNRGELCCLWRYSTGEIIAALAAKQTFLQPSGKRIVGGLCKHAHAK